VFLAVVPELASSSWHRRAGGDACWPGRWCTTGCSPGSARPGRRRIAALQPRRRRVTTEDLPIRRVAGVRPQPTPDLAEDSLAQMRRVPGWPVPWRKPSRRIRCDTGGPWSWCWKRTRRATNRPGTPSAGQSRPSGVRSSLRRRSLLMDSLVSLRAAREQIAARSPCESRGHGPTVLPRQSSSRLASCDINVTPSIAENNRVDP
jgi:hypothetical protein